MMESPIQQKSEHFPRSRTNQRVIMNQALLCVVGFSAAFTLSIIYSEQIIKTVHFVYSLNKFHKQNAKNVTSELDLCPVASKMNLCSITSKNLVGPFVPDLNTTDIDEVEEKFKSALEPGGYFKPAGCISRDRVAILVPVRNRDGQIPHFLKNLHPMLQRQQIEYQIFFVHQAPGYWFNRGALFNVGFIEALKMREWDCFIFHDVDTIPIDDRNLYVCPRTNPRHLGVAIDRFNFKPLYEEIFGAVSAFTTDQYRQINGHANSFWGWGGEDNDIRHRVINAGYTIERYPLSVARYASLLHPPSNRNTNWAKHVDEGQVPGRSKKDGLNSIKYHIKNIQLRNTFTSILVDFNPQEMGRNPIEVKEKPKTIEMVITMNNGIMKLTKRILN